MCVLVVFAVSNAQGRTVALQLGLDPVLNNCICPLHAYIMHVADLTGDACYKICIHVTCYIRL